MGYNKAVKDTWLPSGLSIVLLYQSSSTGNAGYSVKGLGTNGRVTCSKNYCFDMVLLEKQLAVLYVQKN